MPRSGPRQIYKYSKEFKLAAVRLSQVPRMQVKTVATALGIHPFMLSKWRKDVRDGTLRGRLPKAAPAGPAREIAQLQALEKRHALLQEEHDLLKKAIRFCASRKRTLSRSSTPSAPRTASRGSVAASA
jgi:transposase